MRGRLGQAAWVALALALAGLAIWRGACVLAGPDVDTDAYAHHMIARAILADPRDLAVHWVWLPLFHYAQVPLVALGGTMNDVRWINVALAAATPAVLFAYVRRTARSETVPADAVALVAALIAAACPIAMQMGTTAQPEPLFALMCLGVAIAFQERRHLAAAALLGAAVLLRYEAWAMLATAGAVLVFEAGMRMRRARRGDALPPPESPRRWWIVGAPVALILGWAALRLPVDGRWFGFLGQTHEFAAAVVDGKGGASGPLRVARDLLLYYPVDVALHVLGPAVVLAAFGLARAWRQQGARFVLILAAGLGFVSLTWANHSSLGLDRHFVVVVPLYATCAAQGVATFADAAARGLGRVASAPRAQAGARAVAGLLSVGALATLAAMLVVWMGFWRGAIAQGWPARAALGAYLRLLPEGTTVFCDDATLEILSGLDRRRFDRHWMDDPHTWDLVERVARERGVAYVATWQRKLNRSEGEGPPAGAIVFRVREVPEDPASELAVVRVSADAGRAAR